MKCPRCNAPMKDVRAVAVCVSCGGAFVACAAVDTVRRAFDDHAQSMAALAAEHATRRNVDGGGGRMPCPSCAREMTRFLVGPIEVDTCLEHGSWYDRGELVSVRDALRAGAPTAEVAPAPKPAAVAAAPAAAPLELARPLQKSKPSTPRAMDGDIDPGAQAAISGLIKHEHAEARRARNRDWNETSRRRSHGRRHGSDHSALEVVEDVLDILDMFD